MIRGFYIVLFLIVGLIFGVMLAQPVLDDYGSNSSRMTVKELLSVRSSLEDSLREATNIEDSIRLYYDIYDLGPSRETRSLIFTIYDLAVRAGDEKTEFDMLRQCAVRFSDDTVIMNRALSVAQEKAKSGKSIAKETLLFVKMICTLNNIGNSVAVEAPLDAYLNNLIARYISNPPTDPYDRFEILFSICAYMGNLGEGPSIETYTEKLFEAMDALDLHTGTIRNVVFNRTADSYANLGMTRKALDTDRRLLVILDSMERQYREDGRRYRNLDGSRYRSYRRMLANASAMRRPEVERIWATICDLRDHNQDVKADMDSDARTEIYYLMATEQYDKAAPMIIDRVINNPRPLPAREILYNNLIMAAEKTGNKDLLIKAYKIYSDMLLKRLANRQAESIRELSVAYSVNDLKEENSEIQHELVQRKLKTSRAIIILSMCLVLLLGTGVFALLRQRKRREANAKTIAKMNETLLQERDKLEAMKAELIVARDEAKASDKLKTDFINNMSHEIIAPLDAIEECTQLIIDCIPDDKQTFLDKYGRVVGLNVHLVRRVVRDVLDLADLENRSMSVEISAVPMRNFGTFILDSLGDHFKKGVDLKMELTPAAEHKVIVTDKYRVGQILLNLIDNAEKFTENGSVTLILDFDEETNTAIFSVTDTGIGVPRGKEDEIFERFRQLDMNVPGVGLGLYISRLIADLIGGAIRVDETYRGGAKFDFYLPLKD